MNLRMLGPTAQVTWKRVSYGSTRLTKWVAAYNVCTRDFVYGIFLMGLGIDSTVIADGVDLLTFPSNLGDSVAFGVLELLNKRVDDIDEDDL